MKVAVLLTGNLRSFEFTKRIQKKLFECYDTHYFLSIDTDNSLQREYCNSKASTNMSMVEKAISFFHPKKYCILHEFEDEFRKCANTFHAEIKHTTREDISYYKRPLRQYYCVKQAYTLLREYIEEHAIQFDIVVRLRFDQFIWDDSTGNILHHFLQKKAGIVQVNQKYCIDPNYERTEENDLLENSILENKHIRLHHCLDNHVYVFGFGVYHNNNALKKHEVDQNLYANDQFWYHAPSLIHTMHQFYDELIDLILYRFKHTICIYNTSTENLFYTFLQNKHITIAKSSVKGVFVREHATITK